MHSQSPRALSLSHSGWGEAALRGSLYSWPFAVAPSASPKAGVGLKRLTHPMRIDKGPRPNYMMCLPLMCRVAGGGLHIGDRIASGSVLVTVCVPALT